MLRTLLYLDPERTLLFANWILPECIFDDGDTNWDYANINSEDLGCDLFAINNNIYRRDTWIAACVFVRL